MKIDPKAHTQILIGSINKELKNARRLGTYSVRDLYFLNCLAKTLSLSCHIGMREDEQRELSMFYFRFIAGSNKFCVHEFESEYYKKIENTSGLFVQTVESGSTSAPTVSNFVVGDPVKIINQDYLIPNFYNNVDLRTDPAFNDIVSIFQLGHATWPTSQDVRFSDLRIIINGVQSNLSSSYNVAFYAHLIIMPTTQPFVAGDQFQLYNTVVGDYSRLFILGTNF